jgi:ATP-dependent Lhr-like helicase
LRGPTRSAGTGVILVNGALAAYLTKGDRALLVFLPEDEPARSTVATEVARMLFALATGGSDRPGMLIADINGMPATTHPLAEFLLGAGFHRRPTGFQAAPPRD